MMLQIQHQTPNQQLILEQAPVPEISPGQVLVKVTAFGLNRADTLQRQGKYPPPPGESPIMGLEVAGEVIEVAADVSRWHVGQRVFGLVAGGGYAQYVAVNADHLMAIPDAMTTNEAAGCAEVFLTAYQALFSLGQLKNHQKVLLHAGASGVGSAAIRLAQLVGAKVAVTASSDEKLVFCQQLGAELLINYKQSSFAEQIKTQWGGVDLIVDVVGGDYLNANVKSLNMDGRIVQLAMLGGRYVENFDMALMLAKRATLMASTLRNRSDEYKSQLIQGFVERFAEALATRRLTVCIDSTFAASEIALAHQRLEQNQSMGKLVCYWD
ncbi:NAD(P)H-quinone oxidoreductase [Bowmanella sp. Y26]|uniref:NAD(P)H-quinone oxidoreductase n=1 Tax=Bowmanella yangjiangensis TaxID=2811230 RepID=UPI001BDD7AA8|nr:NAD(P)H-quinone oxidoreductase [Bowmanella yangjiangensis]MBT1065160.1 NAD(P)H-quinone oxidoreductase [Bowmanella yangjiangensis]